MRVALLGTVVENPSVVCTFSPCQLLLLLLLSDAGSHGNIGKTLIFAIGFAIGESTATRPTRPNRCLMLFFELNQPDPNSMARQTGDVVDGKLST